MPAAFVEEPVPGCFAGWGHRRVYKQHMPGHVFEDARSETTIFSREADVV